MREETNRIDESHRKELLKFLLVKTAAVRQDIKPAELLRVRHCYSGVNSEGLRVCLYRNDIYCILGLDYVKLNVQDDSSLMLFYNRTADVKLGGAPRRGSASFGGQEAVLAAARKRPDTSTPTARFTSLTTKPKQERNESHEHQTYCCFRAVRAFHRRAGMHLDTSCAYWPGAHASPSWQQHADKDSPP